VDMPAADGAFSHLPAGILCKKVLRNLDKMRCERTLIISWGWYAFIL